ncbi:GIY-YIG endonuclease [Rhizophagus diaphanus]|uniref:GIY-YIG endonuclease n=2 Tax=Glomeraceae TaxID=36751 RepID=I6XNS8_9GLOM|nr:putative GIY-YIG endonuclease [Glomus sp. DAOM 229456]AFN42465.1 GIY-YIG endonuclease [Rhizophagus irregularis]RGB21507.1 GIY-YIG endonuclease [Rhizophagus diaphanus] [Rhizophagus sp. MUCL 43196]
MRVLIYAKRIYFNPSSEKHVISFENFKQAGVYALVCKVSNKIYIGSSVYLGDRLLDYMQPAYLGVRASSPVIRAIVKYGYINFCFVILETCLPELVLEREQFWLDFLKPEYNLSPTAGSTLGVSLSEASKTKISLARLGKTHTLETRQLMSETRRGPNNPMFGKSTSEETKALLSTAFKGPNGPLSGIPRPEEVLHLMRVNHPHTKAVFQYTQDKKELIAKYDSIRQAAEITGISRNYISKCIKDGILAHGKWVFSLTSLF